MPDGQVHPLGYSAVVVAVAVFAAITSYSHIYDLGRTHAQDGTAARLLPLSVDSVILPASLVLLHESRNGRPAPRLAQVMLWAGLAATVAPNTVAANGLYGASAGVLGAVISAWPGLAFVGSVELAMLLVRRAREVQQRLSDPGNVTDEVEPVPTAVPADVPEPEHIVFPESNGHDAAVCAFADEIATGTVSGIREIRRRIIVGQPRATEVQQRIRTLVG